MSVPAHAWVSRSLSAALVGLGSVVGAVGVVAVPGMVLWWIVAGGAVAGAVLAGVLERTKPASAQAIRACRQVSLLAGAMTTALFAVVVGTVVLLGAVSGPVILVLLLLAGRRLWRGLRWALAWTPVAPGNQAGIRRAPERPPITTVVAVDVRTAELCMAWRRSYLALLDTPSGPARDHIVSLRRDLLDELDRRDHAGFCRWIDAGARAGSDPGRYLATDR